MMPPGTRSASRARCSPTRRLSASLSITHGPAIRNSAPDGNTVDPLIGSLHQRRRLAAGFAAALRLGTRRDECSEQRMWPRRTRTQLGVELAADEPRMIRKL